MLTQNKNIKLILNYVAGPLLFCVLMYSIYSELQARNVQQFSFAELSGIADPVKLASLAAVVCLMIANWGIEARKWQLLLQRSSSISLKRSFSSIMSGNTLALFTPNRLGEYAGRMVHLEKNRRLASIPVTMTCSAAQLLVTLVAGCTAFWLLRQRLFEAYGHGPNGELMLSVGGCLLTTITAFLTFFYFRMGILFGWLSSLRMFKKWARDTALWEDVNATLLLRILSLSVIRYLVFIAQYYLLFSVFEVGINWWQAFWSLSLVFLLIALVPGMGVLTELGVRWKSCFHLLQLFSTNLGGILAVTLVMWLINMVIPALTGAILIMRMKFLRKTGTGFT